MTKCISCGKEHGMVIQDTVTGIDTPIDYCYECIFKNCRYEPNDMQIDINDVDYMKTLRVAQDKLIRYMMISSAYTLPLDGDPPCTP